MTRNELKNLISSLLPSNKLNEITASDLRDVLDSILNNSLLSEDLLQISGNSIKKPMSQAAISKLIEDIVIGINNRINDSNVTHAISVGDEIIYKIDSINNLKPTDGEIYSIRLWGTLVSNEESSTKFSIYTSNNIYLGDLIRLDNYSFGLTFVWSTFQNGSSSNSSELIIKLKNPPLNTPSEVRKLILILGNKIPIEWRPSISDIDNLINNVKLTTETNKSNIEKIVPLNVVVDTSTGNLIINGDLGSSTLQAKVYYGIVDITDDMESWRFSWERISEDTIGDDVWNSLHKKIGKNLIIKNRDLLKRTKFNCVFDYEGLEFTKYLK